MNANEPTVTINGVLREHISFGHTSLSEVSSRGTAPALIGDLNGLECAREMRRDVTSKFSPRRRVYFNSPALGGGIYSNLPTTGVVSSHPPLDSSVCIYHFPAFLVSKHSRISRFVPQGKRELDCTDCLAKIYHIREHWLLFYEEWRLRNT